MVRTERTNEWRTTTLPFQPPEIGRNVRITWTFCGNSSSFCPFDCVQQCKRFLMYSVDITLASIPRISYQTLCEPFRVFLGAPVASLRGAVGWLACRRPACSRQTHTVHYQGRTSKGVRQLLVGSATVRCVPCSSCVGRADASALLCNWYCKRCSYEAVICTKRLFFSLLWRVGSVCRILMNTLE